ncbi:copper chaperone PCu(A)C [Microbacterium sp.]|uniref:copper chaperone PCu(A)C n=1 Tax=Microbacterium sp. TaxID=51671 RepID=UPI003A8C659D
MSIRSTIRSGAVVAAAALAIALTGCASDTSTTTAGDTTAAVTTAAEQVTITDSWVKAAEEGTMTAAFGEVSNAGDADVTVTAVSTDAAPMVELHETVADDSGEMTMRQIEGGFVIPAGGTLTLEPGGNHIMLMSLPATIAAGDDIAFTMTFSDDSTLEFTAPAKDYAGANENYDDGESMNHDDMDH